MSRRVQPYRKGSVRPAGPTLAAMIRGRSRYMPNPQDASRKAKKMLSGRVRVQTRRKPPRGI